MVHAACVAIWKHGGSWGFNRPAAAIVALIRTLLSVTCTNYFDDYTLLEEEELASGADRAVKELLDIIG